MDAKDLRTEVALGERSNDGNGKYSQAEATLPCDRSKLYQDITTNTLAKVDTHSARPCAVIGPDRVVLPAAANDSYPKKAASIEPWPCSENTYHRPPDYPYKLADYQHPTRNISPRQTFQENMQRIMMPPRYNPVKSNEDSNYPTDGNIVVHKGNKLNGPSEVDVPYTLNPMSSEQRNIRNPELCVSDLNPALVQNVPPGWPTTGVNVRPARPYGVPELYQYPEYPNCGSRPIPMTRQSRMMHEEPSRLYPDPYYEGNVRFKPYPIIKERYPQPRYEYVTNYTNPYQQSFPSHKYDLQKSLPPHAYPNYPQVPLKYMNSRIVEPVMEGYQRANQQINYNIPFRTQVVHPNYGPVPGNSLQNKFYSYPPDSSVKPIVTNKLPYDNNKMYFEYENARTKAHSLSENFYANDTTRSQIMKGSLVMPNYGQVNVHSIPPQTYHRKEGPHMKSYEYLPQFRYMDPQLNNPLSKIPSQFSPNAITISPTDSNTSNDTTQTLGTLQEDYGYVSQSSSASMRSMNSGVNKTSNDIYKRYDHRYNYVVRNSPFSSKSRLNSNSNINAKDNVKKDIDVRQFLQMWNEGDDEMNDNNTNKEITMQAVSQKTNSGSDRHDMVNNQEQLYVLGLVNVPSDELSKYEHIQKISKLPENIKGYNSTELLNQFEEVIESSNLNNYNSKPIITREVSTRKTTPQPQEETIQRPLSPLDVEAKISQSVIHKEVGCNFEIKPCSPKMLNVEMATPIHTILGERLIEKVSNPHMKSSTSLHNVNENNCNIIKCQNPLDENLKTPSCKMVNSQYSNNDNSIKPDYNLQDLEANSGVCLASLPRLDNDIELNFPEVNQQFIKANKMDSVITTRPKDLPTLDTENSENIVISDNKQEATDTNLQYSSEIGNKADKEFVKLSKYRKLKKTDLEFADSHLNVQALRTDSVIIKNPDNMKDLDENSELSTNILTKSTQQRAINLSPHCETSTKDPVLNETAHTKINEIKCTTNIPSAVNSDINVISNKDNNTKASVPSPNCHALISSNDSPIDKELCPNLPINDDLSSSALISTKDPLLQHSREDLLNSDERVSNTENNVTMETKTDTINSDITAVLNNEVSKIQVNDPVIKVSEDKEEIDCYDFDKKIQNETFVTSSPDVNSVNKLCSIEEDCLNNKTDTNSVSFGCELPENKTSANEEILKYDMIELTFDEKINSGIASSTSATVSSNAVDQDNNDIITRVNMDVLAKDEQYKEILENSDAKVTNCTDKNIYHIPTDKNTNNSLSGDSDSTYEKYSVFCFDYLNTKIQVDEHHNLTSNIEEHNTEMQNTKSLDNDIETCHEIDNVKLEKDICLKTFRYIHKELYSPWIQKLLMYSEGNYTKSFNENLIDKHHNLNETNDLDTKTQTNNHLIFNINDTNNIIRKLEVSNMDELSNAESTAVNINCTIHSDDEPDKGKKDCNSNDIKDNLRQENETMMSSCGIVNTEPILMQTREDDDNLIKTSVEIDVINTITSTIKYGDTIDITKSQHYEDTVTNNTLHLLSIKDTSQGSKNDNCNKESSSKNVCRQQDNQFTCKPNIYLKRSLSDSALNAYCDDGYCINSKQTLLEKRSSLWPNKRKKIMDTQNTIETQIITGSLCNIIQNNRRNSLSSIYNEEAVSFCILIDDNNCIITEETEDSDKVCFTEIIPEEDSLSKLETTETISDEDETNLQTTLEVTTRQVENNVDYSNSLVFDCLEEKMLEDSWVEDVACVETVISEEIAADVIFSASNSPESISEYICNNTEDFDIAINEQVKVMNGSDSNNLNSHDLHFDETNVTPEIDINSSLNDRESQIIEEYNNSIPDNSLLEEIFLETKKVDTPANESFHSVLYLPDSLQFVKKENEKDTLNFQCQLSKFGNDLFQNADQTHIQALKTQDDTVHSCESSVDNVFAYREKEETPKYMSSSSPEVSSTTSEEKKSSIFLKITNYKGSRISQVNNFGTNGNNRPASKFTEEKYLNSNNDLSTIRPLLTKAAQKYIPPLKETIRNFKVKLPLPQESLIRLKQLKKSKEEPKPVINFNLNRHKSYVTRQEFPKKPKPNFEDVLKSIDEIQFKMHKEKTKRVKKLIPKVVIKKHENGSHYTSTSNKDTFNPDLTGNKWQPWVFLERNIFIDKMALKGKTRAVFSHRKNTYVLAEKFQKYKSIGSTNFVISQASLCEPKGQLKYTIRLQHRY